MKHSKKIILLLVLLFSTKSYSYHTNTNKSDPIKYTILKWDNRQDWIFKNVTSTNLSKTEIKLLEQILKKAINGRNLFPAHSYWKQFIPVINKKGQKEVWVNCFCENDNPNWKNEIVYVDDGGNCYFNIKVNLTLRSFYDLRINGYG